MRWEALLSQQVPLAVWFTSHASDAKTSLDLKKQLVWFLANSWIRKICLLAPQKQVRAGPFCVELHVLPVSAWVNRLLQVVCRSELEWLFVPILYWKNSVRFEEVTDSGWNTSSGPNNSLCGITVEATGSDVICGQHGSCQTSLNSCFQIKGH